MGGFATSRLKKRFRVKSSKTGRFDCLHRMFFQDVKGRRKQEDDGQTAEVPKKKVGWAGKRKVRIKERAVLDN